MQYSDVDVFCKASKFQKSIALDIQIIPLQNPVCFCLNRLYDLGDSVADSRYISIRNTASIKPDVII